jgi:hypothetical protein
MFCFSNTIIAGTVLPPNLQVLYARDCRQAEPLLQLQHLKELRLYEATTTAGELTQLRSLTNLRSIALRMVGIVTRLLLQTHSGSCVH